MNLNVADLRTLPQRRSNRVLPVVALMFALILPAFAEESPTAAQASSPVALSNLRVRYPAGSIQSQETAEQALGEAARERSEIEARYAREQQACSPKFFATSCLDTAKEHRRFSLTRVRSVEVEANAFKRRARVIERDQAMAERATQGPAVPPKHVERQGKTPVATTQSSGDASSDAKPAETKSDALKPSPKASSANRIADHDTKLKRLQAREIADKAKREQNAAAFEKRAREAESRQREIADKKAKKEKERADKLRAEKESQAQKQ